MISLLTMAQATREGRKTQTQKEFLRMFRAAAENGCQVVTAASAAPEELGVLTEGLAGSDKALIADIRAPEPGERTEFVRQAAERYGLTLSDSVLERIAEQTDGDYRRIIGAMVRLRAEAELSDPGSDERS